MGLISNYEPRETCATIGDWALETFGPRSTPQSIAARALVEAAELVQECVSYDRDRGEALAQSIAKECADVYIVLARIAHEVDCNMVEAARREYQLLRVEWFGSHASLASSATELVLKLCATTHPKYTTFELLGMIGARLQLLVASIGQGELLEHVDAKMEVNRARKWRLDGNGHGQHVEEVDCGLQTTPAQ
jgi:NTP pyrophosphatase (non-canonical NTP hydrolase)